MTETASSRESCPEGALIVHTCQQHTHAPTRTCPGTHTHTHTHTHTNTRPPLRQQGLVVPERATVGWFKPRRPELFAPSRLPVWLLQLPGRPPFYGFPEFGGEPGFKLGAFNERGAAVADPEALDRAWSREGDEGPLREAMAAVFPEANGDLLRFGVCMFSGTPDGHFIVDLHPRHPQVCCCVCA
jgi:sarcosine oxidase